MSKVNAVLVIEDESKAKFVSPISGHFESSLTSTRTEIY